MNLGDGLINGHPVDRIDPQIIFLLSKFDEYYMCNIVHKFIFKNWINLFNITDQRDDKLSSFI